MSNKNPKFDGEVRDYDPLGALETLQQVVPSFDPQSPHNSDLVGRLRRLREDGAASDYRIFYVNGMQTSPRQHRQAAELLATITNRSVTGIYNQTGNSGFAAIRFLQDLRQSIREWLLPVGRTRDPVNVFFERHFFDAEHRYERFRRELTVNLAAVSLFERLYDICSYERVKTIIVGHSQGNLVTANVAWSLFATLYPNEIPRRMKVFGLASPNPSWPDNGRNNFYFTTYRDPRDPVTLASVPMVGSPPRVERGNTPINIEGLDFSFTTHDVRLYLLTDNFLADLTSEL